MYHQAYLRVAVGQLRDQIEFNKELVRLQTVEQQTCWSTTISHTPKAENKKMLTCKNGCCIYEM
jgi:hypothetical protein